MPKYWRGRFGLVLLALALAPAAAQPPGSGGTLRGMVRDSSGAPAPAAAVELLHPAGGVPQQRRAGTDGAFLIQGIAPGSYRLRVSLAGFETYTAEVAIRPAASVEMHIRLDLAGQRTSVTVAGGSGGLIDSRPGAAETVDGTLLAVLPALSPDSGLNDAIVLTAAGVAADSNGFFHPLGDHAQVSYVVDGQPIADQRNKVFSTSIPANAIQSMEMISSLPAAEYGDKTSLVINAATRSALGQKPSASLAASYGSFGSPGEEATLGLGTARFGSFLAFNAARTGRFLDTPEFRPIHDIGNTGAVFERIDLQRGKGTFHLSLLAARNWMQVPNTYDQPEQDQRQKVVSWNVAPGYQHTAGPHTLASVNVFLRRDAVNYYPSRDPAHDLPATVAQSRSLVNAGVRADISRMQGRHNWKAGVHAARTRLEEEFRLGVTDPAYPAPPAARSYRFHGRADIDQLALFAQDSAAIGPLTLSLGLRYDDYRGLTRSSSLQPRGAFSYLFRPTRTVLRGGYSRTMETPTNENLVVSSSTGPGGLAASLFAGGAAQRPLELGRRNQYDAGIQQPLGRRLLLDVSYFRKYTRNAYDFDALLGTPITFPIGWKQSKLDGVSARLSTTDLHGLRLFATMGHANARFFGPENGGIIFNANLAVGAYRQDHDQVFQHNLNVRYQPPGSAWWTDAAWRYDSGLVVGAVNQIDDALALTADQQAVIGLYCGAERASLSHRITRCEGNYGAARIRILAPGAANDDHNPPRTTPRHAVSLSLGNQNLFGAERIRTSVRVTVRNALNTAALYNFLSPFSGTHWLEPRTWQLQLGWAF